MVKMCIRDRGGACVGDPGDEDHHLPGVGGRLELQVVDGGGGDVPPAVAAGGHGGSHVDPLHQHPAKEAARAVDVAGHDDVGLLGAGEGRGFGSSGHESALLSVGCMSNRF